MKYTNLRTKTIFDFTQDPKIIWEQFGISESAKEYGENLSLSTRIKDYLDLAELTGDKALENAVHEQFSKELSLIGFE